MIDKTKRRLIAAVSAASILANRSSDTVPAVAGARSDGGQVPQPSVAPETSAGISASGSQYLPDDPRRYGAAIDTDVDSAPAIQTAIRTMAASGGGTVTLPAGTLRCESDVVLDARVVLKGHQFGSHLAFIGASLLLDGSRHSGPNRYMDYAGIHDLRVSRTGDAGYAVRLIGDGGTGKKNNRDIVRFDIRRLQILGSSGGGLEIRGAYIAAIHNLIVQKCAGTGLLVAPQAGKKNTALNGAAFFGGEIQNCKKAADLTRLRAVGFYGFVFEGNDEGVDIHRGAAITLDTCYFEVNGSYDLRIGEGTRQPVGPVVINGCLFTNRNDYAIHMRRVEGIAIDSCYFANYASAGILIDPTRDGAVTGRHRHCVVRGKAPQVADGENTHFHQELDDKTIGGSVTWKPGAVASGAMRARNMTVLGAAPGDFVLASTAEDLQDLALSGYVKSADTVRMVLSNNTGATVKPPGGKYRVVVFKGAPA